MRNFMTKFLLALCVLVPSTASAQQWLPLSGVTLNNDGTPYWDNTSFDGTNCNIGYVLTGVATHDTCSDDRPNVGWLPIDSLNKLTLANGFYNAVSGFDPFTQTASLTLFGDIAGQDRGWGWYTDSTFINLNAGVDSVSSGQTVVIGTTAGAWGLWAELIDGTIHTSTGAQFAFFARSNNGSPNPNSLWFGIEDILVSAGDIEDILVSAGDKDYNDISGRLEFASTNIQDFSSVPEPSTYMMMAAGMLVIAGYRAKQKRS